MNITNNAAVRPYINVIPDDSFPAVVHRISAPNRGVLTQIDIASNHALRAYYDADIVVNLHSWSDIGRDADIGTIFFEQIMINSSRPFAVAG